MNNKEFYEECLFHICSLFNIVLERGNYEDDLWYKNYLKRSFEYEIAEFERLIKELSEDDCEDDCEEDEYEELTDEEWEAWCMLNG